MTRSSDKNSRGFERNMANDLKWELPLKVLLISQKGLGLKITTSLFYSWDGPCLFDL